MEPKVSIIVPVYNAQEYLKRCVDSILSQDYRDFELLLMDDGSKDASGEICDAYAQQDGRVRVIHKENSGVSDTRNQALELARGTFLQFLDSDDWIVPEATRLLVRSMEEYNCDMVISDFYRVSGERLAQKGDIEEDKVMSRQEFASYMIENPADFYYGVLWNKMYRRSIIEEYHIRMDTSISWCEDFLFNLEYILHANVFYALQAPVYYYVKTKGSLASQGLSITKTVKMKFMVFEYYNEFYKNVYDEKAYEKKRLSVYRFFLDAASDGTVPPTLLPGAKKLGTERIPVCPSAISGEGILSEFYRSRKLLDRCLEAIALRNDLTLGELSLLLSLSQMHTFCSRTELADFAGLSKSSLSRTLQKLSAKDYIRVISTRKYLHVDLLPAATALLPELATAQNDFDAARFAGFSEEELICYAKVTEKIKENTMRVLGV
mgnify:CR=1 FL=1